MPVLAFYDFNDTDFVLNDTAIDNGAQNGLYLNGASASGGRAILDGVDDQIKIDRDPTFQLDRGTLEIQFSQTAHSGTEPNTVLSRDSEGLANGGGFRIEVLPDGAVVVSHETATETVVFTTGPGFLSPGDEISLSYSWDLGGDPGALIITNSTTGTTFTEDVPNTLTMNTGTENLTWFVGVGQSNSPSDSFRDMDQYFNGEVEFFSISDTVDNKDNLPPVAADDTAETDEDTPVTVDVLGNDSDPNGDPLTVTSATATNGTVTINPDGTLLYTPNPDFNGTDTITYLIDDGRGGTDTGEVTVTVNPVNDAPVANDDLASTALNTPVTIAVLSNDTDVDGDTLSILGTPTSADGTVAVNPDGTITFTPTTGFTGVAVVDYTITDGNGGTDTAQVFISVNTPDNTPPVAIPDYSETAFNTPITFAVLGNDIDPDGDALSILGSPTSPDGAVSVNGDGTLTFTPTAGFTGTAVVTYSITDGNGGTDTTEWYIRVGDPTGPDGIVSGTPGDDVIDLVYTGDPDGDLVDAGDAIIPGAEPDDDVIVAGPGDDTVRADLGDDLVFGGGGNDDITGGPGDDTLLGEDGDDRLTGGDGDDLLVGDEGNDTIVGGNGNDLVFGGGGDDDIDTSGTTEPLPDRGYPGLYPGDSDPFNDRDTVYGGDGNDTIRTGDDNDLIYAGAGADSVDAGWDDDTVYGGVGNDTIIGNEGRDLIFGEDGDDVIYGGAGPDVPDAVNIPDDAGDLRPDNANDTIFGGAGNDTIFGDDDADVLYGDDGDDLLDGGVDDDQLFGGAGNDTLIGGHGFDQLDGGAGDDSLDGGTGNDTVLGGAGNDTVRVTDGIDVIDTGDDRDTIVLVDGQNSIGTFIDGGEGGDDFDTLDLRDAGPRRIAYDSDNPENGTIFWRDADGNEIGTTRFENIERVICFTPGTLIATPRGEIPVEDLREGDRVITRDNGIQQIRWAGKREMSAADFTLNPHLRPVLIKRGALGNGLPERDMMLSPNHRVLVANDSTSLYFDEREVLVAAKHLVSSQGVMQVQSAGTTYHHVLFDRHEVVLSDGAWTESFQPGDYSLKGLGNAQRTEIFEIFPELREEAGVESYGAARRTLKKHEAALLVKL